MNSIRQGRWKNWENQFKNRKILILIILSNYCITYSSVLQYLAPEMRTILLADLSTGIAESASVHFESPKWIEVHTFPHFDSLRFTSWQHYLPAPRRTLWVGTILTVHIPQIFLLQKLVCVLLVLIQPHFPFFLSKNMRNWENPVSRIVTPSRLTRSICWR